MSKRKKIGIITMHRVYNAGSALQAYALYHTVRQLGYDCEIIDYQYPNIFHHEKKGASTPLLKRLWERAKYFVLYRSRTQHARFEHFQANEWESSPYYETRESIFENAPQYDLCITGSDQVWNPRCMKGDTVFFCAFSPNTPHIAYASSFAQGAIPQELQPLYAQHLSTYRAIGVRESSGVELISKLIGLQAKVVCDPTLLLTAADYIPFIKQAFTYTKKRYLLAYILDYAFNPHPTISQLIKRISKERNLEVIYLMANTVNNYKIGHSITSAGPNEFLKLFSEATYVVTSSFHGVAFSLLFEKDFHTIIPNNEQEDGRIHTLLKTIGAENRAVRQGTDISNIASSPIDYAVIRPELDKLRRESLDFLQTAIKDAL